MSRGNAENFTHHTYKYRYTFFLNLKKRPAQHTHKTHTTHINIPGSIGRRSYSFFSLGVGEKR